MNVLILDFYNHGPWFPCLLYDLFDESEKVDINYELVPYAPTKLQRKDITNNSIKFKFKNTNFCFKWNAQELNHSEVIKLIKKYDAFYFLQKQFFLDGLNSNQYYADRKSSIEFKYSSIPEFKRKYKGELVFNTEESIDSGNNIDYNFFNKNNCKLISCYTDSCLDKLSEEHFLHIPFISFHEFFYDKRYYYLDYNIDIPKKNMIGTYHISNYKIDRDIFIKKINNFLSLKDKESIKIYGQTLEKNLPQEIYEYSHEGWQHNHITNYMDFSTSTLNLIFETEFNSTKWFTEKTFKALLFSNCTYNLLLKDFESLKYLKDNGYWLLNFEFIDWDITYEDGEYNKYNQHIEDSIIKSIQLTSSLGNTSEEQFFELDKIYGDKRRNTFNKILQWIQKPTHRDEILNFLFKDIL